ncbi:chemotaxis response regulator protein-glutamate methylesterase [Zhengella mangrovi]|uniref:Protein-glutamate methylesterase/protein-glutamine glutaminase n=1 Tax=Zhengella mangrovi TaxID=1982044 RepID=A0A2G1QJJ1_9HYPH|nr:chemotaxis response regulator protein-glutamate methylesterase [Zhengella mangrovi]PHP65695.1 chemotaxis response regulator protein-glutamate methylesterase [Zhengella mangrovi]
MTRVLIVDDSAMMRHLLTAILDADPAIEVIGTAGDPYEARALIKELNPDVITLDLEMPNMNGIDFLHKIMQLRPMPVVVISSHVEQSAAVAREVMEAGAYACLPKPKLDDESSLLAMRRVVRQAELVLPGRGAADGALAPRTESRRMPETQPLRTSAGQPDMIAIGASTGGIEAISEILSTFSANCPPTVIVQHLPAGFSRNLAERLNRLVQPTVKEAADGEALAPGTVYIAPGGERHLVVAGASPKCKLLAGDAVTGHRPSIDVLFGSLAQMKGISVSAALLTGMGADGARGLLQILRNGGRTISQDEATSLIYGMPRAAAELGAASEILPINRIADALLATRKNTENEGMGQ